MKRIGYISKIGIIRGITLTCGIERIESLFRISREAGCYARLEPRWQLRGPGARIAILRGVRYS